MQQRDSSLAGSDGGRIFYRVWEPGISPRALLLLVHGMGEHSGRYQHVAQYFADRGYAMAALDHYGHGRSAGEPGYVPRFAHYVDTLELFQQQLRSEFPTLPVYMIGHSMGGLICANYLLQHQHKLAGCILSGPALQASAEPGAGQLLVLKLMSMLLPRVGFMRLDGSAVSRDSDVVEAYFNDPLVYNGKWSARLIAELLGAMQGPLQAATNITLPMLMMHGGADSMTSPEGSRRFCDRLASADKQLIVYPELYHEIFNEPEKEQVLGDLAAWLDQRQV